MEKPKREVVTSEMRLRLLENRHGKLTIGQWRELIFEPLIPILLLLVPIIIGMRSMMLTFIIGQLWLVGIGGLAAITAMLFFRARHYERIPLHYAELTADVTGRPVWKLWGSDQFITANDDVIRFRKRLAPNMPLTDGAPYMVYYLQEGKTCTLLSIAPVDHPNADSWKPSKSFEDRFKRRTG